VIYVGSLSKSLFPGLRLGFMVAPSRLIEEARAMRRLMVRHPPSINQRTVALFLSLGHYDTLVRRMHRVLRERWEIMGEALHRHLPDSTEACATPPAREAFSSSRAASITAPATGRATASASAFPPFRRNASNPA